MLWLGCVNAATIERVNVDLSKPGGLLEHRASGFLHSITLNAPADDLIAPLKPRLFRERPEGKDAGVFLLYPRLTRMGAAIQIVLSDGYTNYQPPWPGDNGDWSRWETHIANHIRRANNGKMELQWDLWNEPDNDYFWKPSAEQFLETWKRTYRLVRTLSPNATIVGPSLSNRKSKKLSLDQFLLFAKANNCLPDVLSWHQFNGNISASVDEVRKFMSANGIRINRISLNEIISGKYFINPGHLPRYFTEIERTKVESAAHACWQESNGAINCDNASLDGLLTHDSKRPRSVWQVYAAYGLMSGRVGEVMPTATVDGLATLEKDTASVLLGRFKEGKEAVELAVTGLKMARNGKVRVKAYRIPDSGLDALETPLLAIDELHPVGEPIALPDFGPTDAYFVTIARP